MSTIDSLGDDWPTGFAMRLALDGHRGVPRESKFDFLKEAESVFLSPRQPRRKVQQDKEAYPNQGIFQAGRKRPKEDDLPLKE